MTYDGFKLGEYVRHIGTPEGTGKVVSIHRIEKLVEKTIQHQTLYGIDWYAGGLPDVVTAMEIAPTARSVPAFASVEEAEAWATSQLESNWADETIQAATTLATATTCGTGECRCNDCFTHGGEHVYCFGCTCVTEGCPCSR